MVRGLQRGRAHRDRRRRDGRASAGSAGPNGPSRPAWTAWSGPAACPQQVVRFVLAPRPLPGERTVALPMADEGGLFGGWGRQLCRDRPWRTPLRIRFNPHHPRTFATAGAGVRLAAANDARIGGEVESPEIAFGIARPVRTLHLGTPLQVGPLTITRLGVRTADFGSAASIREEDGDPDEIVVTARARRDHRRDRIAIGADLLARCSSLVFDKRAREIRLTCAYVPATVNFQG